ncbi:hypothetical protein [Sorangium sp. So ce693]|uniref:hypothetical protein n=1 Tax=Sorangium sp. So ce693 TaxID=3133318 RepID=UPI003F5F0F8F
MNTIEAHEADVLRARLTLETAERALLEACTRLAAAEASLVAARGADVPAARDARDLAAAKAAAAKRWEHEARAALAAADVERVRRGIEAQLVEIGRLETSARRRVDGGQEDQDAVRIVLQSAVRIRETLEAQLAALALPPAVRLADLN